MSNRSKGRQQIVQILYLMEHAAFDPEQALDFFQKNFEVFEREIPFIRSRVEGVYEHQNEIDEYISKTSMHWKLHRIPKIDKSILRLSIFELFYCPDVPKSVIIDEAVELAKKFAEEKSPKFINGVLDKIAKQRETL